jgi:hypothetical protein
MKKPRQKILALLSLKGGGALMHRGAAGVMEIISAAPGELGESWSWGNREVCAMADRLA